MLKRYFLNPENMWARVENGVLLYTPIIVVSDDTHTHIYLSGQTPRVPSGEIPGKDMRDKSGKPVKTSELAWSMSARHSTTS